MDDPSKSENTRADLLLMIPAGALIAFGITLPEYWGIFAGSAFAAMLLLAVIQMINRRDEPRQPPPEDPIEIFELVMEIEADEGESRRKDAP